MRAFAFSLERLLELRRHQQNEEARKLAEARRTAEAARRAEADLREVIAHSRKLLGHAHGDGTTAGQLHNLSFVVDRLQRKARSAAKRRREAEEALEDQERLLLQAVRERRCLDRLKERSRESWEEALRRRDRKELDELAALRHGTERPTGSSGEPR